MTEVARLLSGLRLACHGDYQNIGQIKSNPKVTASGLIVTHFLNQIKTAAQKLCGECTNEFGELAAQRLSDGKLGKNLQATALTNEPISGS